MTQEELQNKLESFELTCEGEYEESSDWTINNDPTISLEWETQEQ